MNERLSAWKMTDLGRCIRWGSEFPEPSEASGQERDGVQVPVIPNPFLLQSLHVLHFLYRIFALVPSLEIAAAVTRTLVSNEEVSLRVCGGGLSVGRP